MTKVLIEQLRIKLDEAWHQVKVNVQIAERDHPEGPTVNGERTGGLMHTQAILAGHVNDRLAEARDLVAALEATLSAPAQRVEEGPELEIGDGILTWRGEHYSINVAADEATLNIFGVGARRIAVGDDLLDAVHAAPPAPQRVEEGWKQVPFDATDAMIEAARAVDMANENEDGALHNVWHVMVSASPAPAPRAGVDAEWQTMETAPGDEETPVLLWMNDQAVVGLTWKRRDGTIIGKASMFGNAHSEFWMPLPAVPRAALEDRT